LCVRQSLRSSASDHGRFSAESESESYVTTDGQSASLSWNKAPIWDLRPGFYYCQTIAGLSFTIAAGPRQRSHYRVRVLWDSETYFTASDSRLPFRRLLRLAGLRWRYSREPNISRHTGQFVFWFPVSVVAETPGDSKIETPFFISRTHGNLC
jgi:hypothetical protein